MTAEFILSAVTSLAALVLAIIAVLQTRRAQHFQEQLSRAQGAFGQINIDAMLFGRNDARKIIFMAPVPPGTILEAPLSVGITNNGDKTAREVEIVVFIPNTLAYEGLAGVTAKCDSPKFTVQPMNTGKWRTELRIRGESLHPQQGLSFKIPISLAHETKFPFAAPATTADGFRIKINVKVTLSYRIDILLLQADKPAKSWAYMVEFLNTTDSTPREVLAKHYKLVDVKHNHKINNIPEPVLVLPLSPSELERDPGLPIFRANYLPSSQIYRALLWEDTMLIPGLQDSSSEEVRPKGVAWESEIKR